MSKKGFSLLEIMVAIVVFALVVASAGGVFISVQRAWQRQKAVLDLIQNARQAMETMTNEIRRARAVSTPPPSGDIMRFSIDPNADGNPPYRTIEYQRVGTILQRRWMEPGVPGGWQPWEELANFIVNNPSTNAIFRPHPSLPNLYIIELTLAQNNRSYTLRTQVRPRN